MSDALVLGRDEDTKGNFEVKPKGLLAHTCIVGKSGCGKTTLVARYIEEIVLRNAGNVVVLDYNNEFPRFADVDAGAFDMTKSNGEKGLCPEDEAVAFNSAWEGFRDVIASVNSDHLRVPFEELGSDSVAVLLGLNADEDPGAYWMVRLLVEEHRRDNGFSSWSDLRTRIYTYERWAEGRRRASEQDGTETAHVIEALTTKLDHARLRNGVENCPGEKYIAFGAADPGAGTVVLNNEYISKLLNAQRFVALDLLNFSYDEQKVRGFVILHVLRSLWEAATKRFRAAKETGTPVAPPLFLVIDEAHNLVRAGETNPIISMVETIAAEGRKFGLFLVLITQRPDKISEKVLSECENYIVMKATPGVVSYMSEKLGVGGDATDLKEKVKSFGVGQAFFYGRFTDDELKGIRGGFRRTR